MFETRVLVIFRFLHVRLSVSVDEVAFKALGKLELLREFLFKQRNSDWVGYEHIRMPLKQHNNELLALSYEYLPKLHYAGQHIMKGPGFEDFYPCYRHINFMKHDLEIPAGSILELRQVLVKSVQRLPPDGSLPRLQSLVLVCTNALELPMVTRDRFSSLQELIFSGRLLAAWQVINELGGQLERLQLNVRAGNLNISELLIRCPRLVELTCSCLNLDDRVQHCRPVPNENFRNLQVFKVLNSMDWDVGGFELEEAQEEVMVALPQNEDAQVSLWQDHLVQLLLQVLRAPRLKDFSFNEHLNAQSEAILMDFFHKTGPNLHNLQSFVWVYDESIPFDPKLLLRAVAAFCPACTTISYLDLEYGNK